MEWIMLSAFSGMLNCRKHHKDGDSLGLFRFFEGFQLLAVFTFALTRNGILFLKNVQTPSSVRTPLSLYHIVSRLCTYNIDRTFHSADSLCPTHLTDQQKVYISSRPRAP